MADKVGEKKKEEQFILLGGNAEAESKKTAAEKKDTHSDSSEKEYVLDFSGIGNFFNLKHGEILSKAVVYILLLIILLLAAYVRLLPIDTYPKEAPIASADPFWQYRHAKEIYEHGYPGQALKETSSTLGCSSMLFCLTTGGKISWDYLHDAPEGGAAPVEFYQYFVGFSYKYFGKSFFPTLFEYIRFTPVLF